MNSLYLQLTCILLVSTTAWISSANSQERNEPPILKVPHCDDFEVTGNGESEAWKLATWTPLARRSTAKHEYDSRFKMLYSDTGVYVLFDGIDQQLTATMNDDFLDLWNEDVYECFFWTDQRHTVYFEYEISPLGFELPIIIPNFEGRFLGWRPWHYDGDRKIRKRVSATGGKNASMAKVNGWSAEVFIPYTLLQPLQNVPPNPGGRWRANFYRVDYDNQQVSQWEWAPVGRSFHEFQKFGTLEFQ
ncbi:MAG: carbohydrate-binding family 9-like protein [Planctomycetales bacterium]|nr:carbohydrate-binding family 9-like protein [Planctomycetales bacterium]